MGFKIFIIPAVIVGLIAGAATQNALLGLIVALGIIVGNGIGFFLGKKD